MPGHSSSAPHDVWGKRLRRFAQSGLPVARFCAAEGVSVASFYSWRKKLMSNPPRDRRAGQRASFQRVAVVAATPAVSIHLPGGTRIEVSAADLDAVRAVIAEVARGAGRQD